VAQRAWSVRREHTHAPGWSATPNAPTMAALFCITLMCNKTMVATAHALLVKADASYTGGHCLDTFIVFSSDTEFSAVEPGRQRRTSWQRRRRERTSGSQRGILQQDAEDAGNTRRLLPPIGAPSRPTHGRRRAHQDTAGTSTDRTTKAPSTHQEFRNRHDNTTLRGLRCGNRVQRSGGSKGGEPEIRLRR
jgi:hypothetical protein